MKPKKAEAKEYPAKLSRRNQGVQWWRYQSTAAAL
jgi:hypothetical protein